ncbi:PIG-L deacetylase family protein [Pseudalkalibacillus sp. Hm43]|uniref:PIG-L deacetylase family protein n=1 Tax=Pseudalkalibacillus sp. Hm43 TaxID=3450742 RepID=UPI003F43AB95
MRVKSFTVLLLIIFFIGFMIFTASKPKGVAIFYSPHPDDETLSMGSTIVHYIKQGYDVHVVLLTEGGGSAVKGKINEKLQNEKKAPLTVEEFKKARVKEFKLAVSELGADEENVHIYGFTDGNLKIDNVNSVMANFDERYPKAQHFAFSYYDPHPDHAATGKALRDLLQSGRVNEGMFFVPRYVDVNVGEIAPFEFRYLKDVKPALDAYGIWNPENGFYSIGKISVTESFKLMEKDPKNKWHKLEK